MFLDGNQLWRLPRELFNVTKLKVLALRMSASHLCLASFLTSIQVTTVSLTYRQRSLSWSTSQS